MPRIIVIGIDGMDPCVVEQIWPQLPHLRSIASRSQYRRCASVFPPDSIPAWVTIFTGQHPALHGWLDNVDYEDVRRGLSAYDVQRLAGRTFWDIAGVQGRRVCVVNPLLAYPVWPVNGVMVSGPVFISGDVQSYPPDLAHRCPLPQLGGMTDLPQRGELEAFAERTRQATIDLAAYGLQLCQMDPWDLFFISFFTLDRLQHFLWRFYDADDPTHPGPSALQRAIPDLYRLFDDIVGRFMQKSGPDTALLVLSDHGHGQRPVLQFNVNELLRQAGLLHTSGGAGIIAPKRWIEGAKNATLRWLAKHGHEDLTYSIARLIPHRGRKALKKSGFLLNRAASLAWASEMGGGTSIGGVELSSQLREGSARQYVQARDQVMSVLAQYGPSSSQPVLRWANPGDQLLANGERGYYPDVVFQLDERYSVGHSLFTDVLARNPRHLRVSGGHKSDGVCFLRGPGDLVLPQSLSLLDISPLILSALGCRSDVTVSVPGATSSYESSPR